MVISQITLMLLRNFFYIMLTCHWQVPAGGREGRCAGHGKGGSRRYSREAAVRSRGSRKQARVAAGAGEGQGSGSVWAVQQTSCYEEELLEGQVPP